MLARVTGKNNILDRCVILTALVLSTVQIGILINTRLEIDDLDVILREKRLRWFGHVERSSGAIKTVRDMQIEGKRREGGPR